MSKKISGTINSIFNLSKSKLGKSAMVYTLSSFCNAAIPFILLPVLTAYLSSAQYGVISTFNALISLLTPFVCMGTTTAIQRKLADKEFGENIFAFNCIFVIFTFEILVSACIFFFRNIISKYTGIPLEFLPYLLIILISNIMFDVCKTIMQMRNKAKHYFVYQNLSTLLNLILSIIFVVLGMQLKGRIYGIAISAFVFGIIGIIYVKQTIGIKATLNKSYISNIIFNYGLPLIPTNIKGTILTYTDRIFITNMISLSATGIYSVANQFSMPIMIFETAFNTAYVPWLFDKLSHNGNKKKIVKFTYIYMVFIAVLSLVWSGLAVPMVRFFTSVEYYGAVPYVFWLSIGHAFHGMQLMVVNYIYYYKKVTLYSFITILILFINIILNAILIKQNGAIGAAQATMLSNGISFIATWILVDRICDMPWFFFLKNKK